MQDVSDGKEEISRLKTVHYKPLVFFSGERSLCPNSCLLPFWEEVIIIIIIILLNGTRLFESFEGFR